MAEPTDAQQSDKDTPTRELSPEDLFVRLQAWYSDDAEHHSSWVDGEPDKDGNGGAKEDFEFVSGRQWDEKALETLRKQNRPASVFDRVAPMIDAVCGYEVANRQEVRFIPRELGDVGINEVLTSSAAWFRDLSDAEDEESDAFRDCAICGKGWIETRIEYETNPDGDPVISRVDPLEIFPDRDACKPNYVDAKRVWRVRRMSQDAAIALIPDADPAELHAGWADDSNEAGSKIVNDRDYTSDDHSKPPAECVIVECQWWEREPFVRFMNPSTGQIEEWEQDKFNTYVERLALMTPEMMMLTGLVPPSDPVVQYRRVYRRAYLGKTILKQPPMPVEGHFTYKAITGKRDRNRNQFIGLVRSMKDPARWTNKLFSQIMHILNSNAKGGIMAERGAFENDRQAAQSWAKGDAITWLNTNGASKIQPKPTSQLPQGHSAMLEFSMGAMPLVTGINQEFLGMREANQPGVLEYQRKQAGLTILATLFDSLRRYRKDQGRLMLRMIQEYLSDGRLVKIVGKQGSQYIPLMRETTLGDYDVIVDDAPTAPNAKERNWSIIQQMLPVLMPLFNGKPDLVAEALRNSPLPESFVQSIIQAITAPQNPPPPDPEAEMMKRLEIARRVGLIEKNQAETENDQASALSRKAKALKDLGDVALPIVLGDLPSPPLPMVPPGFMPQQQPGPMPQQGGMPPMMLPNFG